MQGKKKQPKSEAETRMAIFQQARRFHGPEAERQVRMHFDKYDRILANCRNDNERSHIKKLAVAELYKMMGYYQGLVMNGEEIMPPDSKAEPKEA